MKIFERIIIGLLVLGAMTETAPAQRRIQCEVSVREKAETGDYILIAKRLLSFPEGKTFTSFIANFTLDLQATFKDGEGFDCDFSLFTIDPQFQNIYKRFRAQPGGVYFLDDLRGKNGTLYRVGISPLDIDSTARAGDDCTYDYRADGVWRFDPSANYDFYFVPQTLGDARWNMLRDYLELCHKSFKNRFDLGFPGKVNYFFAPCLLSEIDWDLRAGYALDPARSNCFALYSHENHTIDPFPGLLVRIYRFMGYAPPLLAEGLATYFDFPHYYAKKLKQSSGLPPLSALARSLDYFNQPGHDGISVAGSFVRYLLDQYGFARFRQLYGRATDLTLEASFSEIYEKKMTDLENDWHQYLDTVTINPGSYLYFYDRDRYIYNKAGMTRFLGELKEHMVSREDSLYVFSEEAWNSYMDGDYETSRARYEYLLSTNPQNSTWLMTYGNLLQIDARYDSAIAVYNRAGLADSALKTTLGKIGETFLYQGNRDSAFAYLRRDLVEDPSQLSQATSGILLGQLMLEEGDTSAAGDYYAAAVAAMEQVYPTGKSQPQFLLRLGQAHFGLAICDRLPYATARSFLEQACFFEVHPTRVIFITRILLELGRLADLEGRREDALGYYQEMIRYPLPPYQEAEVNQYILNPFTGHGRSAGQ